MKAFSAHGNVSGPRGPVKPPGPPRQPWGGAKWSPEWLGACCAGVLLVTGASWLCIFGETFFSLTRRLPAEILVVEGWIGNEGVRAAAAEFKTGGYRYLVATGDRPEDGQERWSYAELAARELIRSGVPDDRIVVAPSGETERERSFKSAAATWRALQERGIHPAAINVMTLGPHARRSRLVYEKVYAPVTQVGVIAWAPADYGVEPWWRSGGRTRCFLKEIVGYPFEVLLNSGRSSNSPG